MYHKILQRQVIKQFGSVDKVPPEFTSFLQSINDVYHHSDEDRKLIERSFEISSRELETLNSQIRKERDLAKAIFSSIIDGLIVLNKDLTVDLINPQAERLLSIEGQQNRGKHLDQICKFSKNDHFLSIEEGFASRTIKSGEVLRSMLDDDLYIHTGSEKKFPVVITTVPLLIQGNKEPYGVLVVFQDATGEKQQRELIENEVTLRTGELSAERNRISLILSSITDSVIALDLDNRIVYFNKASEILFDKSAKDVTGYPISKFIHIFEDDVEINPDEYTGSTTQIHDGLVYSKNNLKLESGKKVVYVNFVSGKILDGKKLNIGSIISMHDVTETKLFEEMKIDFVSMAAHELRTPLTAIRGYTSMLFGKLSIGLSDEQKEVVNRLMLSSENLSNLIDNLLNVSRIEQNSIHLHMGVVDLAEKAEKIIGDLQNLANTKKMNLTFVKENENYPLIVADGFRIGLVLTNIIVNAITYTDPGGTITVKLEQKDNFLTVSVKDTGRGIPADALPKLFTKFFRVSGSLERGSKGTGLGLFISKSIIDMHKGKIGVESELNHGSKFYFSLPIASEEEKSNIKRNNDNEMQKYGVVMNLERQKNMKQYEENINCRG